MIYGSAVRALYGYSFFKIGFHQFVDLVRGKICVTFYRAAASGICEPLLNDGLFFFRTIGKNMFDQDVNVDLGKNVGDCREFKGVRSERYKLDADSFYYFLSS